MRRPLKILKLNDEFGNYRLQIRCRSCGYVRNCDPAQLASRVGWECALDSLSRRLRCSKCGHKRSELSVHERAHERVRQIR